MPRLRKAFAGLTASHRRKALQRSVSSRRKSWLLWSSRRFAIQSAQSPRRHFCANGNSAPGHPADFAIRTAQSAEAKEAEGSSGEPFSVFLISRQNDGARKTGVPIKERSAQSRIKGRGRVSSPQQKKPQAILPAAAVSCPGRPADDGVNAVYASGPCLRCSPCPAGFVSPFSSSSLSLAIQRSTSPHLMPL